MMTQENVHEYIQAVGAIMQRGDTMPVDGETLHFTTQEDLWCLLQPEDRHRYFEMLGEMERSHLIHWDRTGVIEVTRDGEGLYEIAKQSRASNPGLGNVVISSAVSGATMQAVSHFMQRLMNSGRQENPSRAANPLGNLPPKAARQWEAVFESAQNRGLSQGAAAAQAWCAVKRGYYKKGNRWLKRKQRLSPSESPPGCEPYSRSRNSLAWETTQDDIDSVCDAHDVKCPDALDEGTVDTDAVEEAVLAYTDFDDQVNAAMSEIEDQLIAAGVLPSDKQFRVSNPSSVRKLKGKLLR